MLQHGVTTDLHDQSPTSSHSCNRLYRVETAPDTLSGAVSIRREFQHAGTEAVASKILPVPSHIKLDPRKRSDKAKHLPSLWTCTLPIGSVWPGADTGAARSVNHLASWVRHYDGGAATLPIGWVQAAGIGNLVRSSGHPTTAPLSTLGMEPSGDALDGQLCAAAAERVEKNQLPKLFGAL